MSADLPADDPLVAVVRKHSAMVLGVCRRMLGDGDAEDAAQAVFVLFWRKSMHLRDESHQAGWLHRTAQHVCRNAGRSRASRIEHERQAATQIPAMTPESADSVQWSEVREILDEEVNRLPEKLRIPFVLFHCEQRSLAEVAALVGSSVPTVGTWLQRARERLAGTLRRRGIAMGAAALTALLSEQLLAETVQPAFVAATVQTVSGVSTAGLAACSPSVALLVKAGVAGGWSKAWWVALAVSVMVIGFPILVLWGLPALQTRQSPHFPLLQGQWQEIAHEQDGAPMAAEPPVKYVGLLQITGHQFHRYQTLADGRVLKGDKGTFVLDSSQSPAAIDFQQWVGTVHGIYELDGDTLTLCVTREGKPRPEALTTQPHDSRMLSRYKRVRP